MRGKSITPEQTFLEVADVARLLGVTPGSVRLYIRKNRLTPAAETPRGVRLFRPGDVQAFEQARKAKATTHK